MGDGLHGQRLCGDADLADTKPAQATHQSHIYWLLEVLHHSIGHQGRHPALSCATHCGDQGGGRQAATVWLHLGDEREAYQFYER